MAHSVKVFCGPDELVKTRNIAYFQHIHKINTDTCALYFAEKNYYMLAKKINRRDDMADGRLYLSLNDMSLLAGLSGNKIKFDVVPMPKAASMVIVSIIDPITRCDITNKSASLLELIKPKIQSTIVNTNVIYCGVDCNKKPFHVKVVNIFDDNFDDVNHAYISDDTEILLSTDQFAHTAFRKLKSINFENIGVGGMEKEFSELVKRLFITRIIPRKLYEKLAIEHMKGAILHGPPGCGKTKLLREMGRIIGCTNIKIVNGPELLDDLVGSSEKNIRECFESAKKKPNELHLLIFDEFDSIASPRADTIVNHHDNKVVNQLLTMLDGVEKTSNLIVFALTNRIDMIDQAFLRPGRFGLQLKIDLPNEHGRYEILKLHTAKLEQNGIVGPDVDFQELAKVTDNFTGAELENLVQMTVQNAIGDQLDYNNIVASARKITDIKLEQKDFMASAQKITPMFKRDVDIIEELSLMVKKKLTDADTKVVDDVLAFFKSKDYPAVCCIQGGPKSGKTSVACQIAISSGLEHIKYVSALQLVDRDNDSKINYLKKVFEKGRKGIIILDGLETIVEYFSEYVFSMSLLQLIRLLLLNTPHNVIITTSRYTQLEKLSAMDSIEHNITLN